MRNGIDPRAITSEAQLKTILNQIKHAKQSRHKLFQDDPLFKTQKSAKVFERQLKGNMIEVIKKNIAKIKMLEEAKDAAEDLMKNTM